MKCNECQGKINLTGVEPEDIVTCPSCGKEYEAKWNRSTKKLYLRELELTGEDWGEIIGLFKLKGSCNSYREWKRVESSKNAV